MPLNNDAAAAQNAGLTLAAGMHLPALDGHRVWWCEGGDGAAGALPVLMVHGGPGGQTRSEPLAWWQGQPVRWIAIDQRGCGRSEPPGAVENNHLEGLLQDMERLREHLGLQRWALAAGSWGALVALAYAQRHPQRVTGLHLRSAFLGSAAEVERYLQPWETWLGEAGQAALKGDVKALRRMFQPATAPRQPETGLTPIDEPSLFTGEALLAQAWARFDDAQSQPGGVAGHAARWSAEAVPAGLPPSWLVFRHYASHGWFLDGPLPDSLPASLPASLRELPVALVHGSRDACCDPAVSRAIAAWHRDAALVEVPEAGHRMGHPALAAALRDSAAAWLRRLRGAPPA